MSIDLRVSNPSFDWADALTAAAGLAVAGGVIYFATRSPARLSGAGSLPTVIPPSSSKGLQAMVDLMTVAGTPPDWQVFFAAVAHHESRWHSNAHNDDPKEVERSGYAYDASTFLHACPWPRSRYAIGSIGWWQIMPAYGMKAFQNTSKQCDDPWVGFDPVWMFAQAVGFSRRLRYRDNFKVHPTWLNLNRGWAGGSYMGTKAFEPTDSRFLEALDALRAQGWSIPYGWQNQAVIDLPLPSPSQIVDSFAGIAALTQPKAPLAFPETVKVYSDLPRDLEDGPAPGVAA